MVNNVSIEEVFNDVIRFRPIKHNDDRGFFSEIYREDLFLQLGLGKNFMQDNFSYSKKKYTIRGLHFQLPPKQQKKVLKIISGKIWDIFIDIRKSSPNYKKFSFIEHGKEDGWLYIPDGYAHGFCTLEDNTELIYKVDNYFDPKLDKGINFLDPYFNINWPCNEDEIIISDKDKNLPFFKDIEELISFSL